MPLLIPNPHAVNWAVYRCIVAYCLPNPRLAGGCQRHPVIADPDDCSRSRDREVPMDPCCKPLVRGSDARAKMHLSPAEPCRQAGQAATGCSQGRLPTRSHWLSPTYAGVILISPRRCFLAKSARGTCFGIPLKFSHSPRIGLIQGSGGNRYPPRLTVLKSFDCNTVLKKGVSHFKQ